MSPPAATTVISNNANATTATSKAGLSNPLSNAIIPTNASEDDIVAALTPMYARDPELFVRALARVRHATPQSHPLFPRGIDVASIAPVPENEAEAFRKAHINDTKLSYDSEEVQERWKLNGRPVQYARWHWASSNIPTYVNMLRQYGHSDDTIQRMLDGVPMCFASRDDYDALRAALRDLKPKVEHEMGWSNVAFVITGSSVPGFSQNPIKGFYEIPSKITDPDNSDVDICIVGDGVFVSVAERIRHNDDGKSEPKKAFVTTIGENANGLRFGCTDISQLSKTVGEFHEKWSEILPGGLQLTFSEDDSVLPPWEARIDIENF